MDGMVCVFEQTKWNRVEQEGKTELNNHKISEAAEICFALPGNCKVVRCAVCVNALQWNENGYIWLHTCRSTSTHFAFEYILRINTNAVWQSQYPYLIQTARPSYNWIRSSIRFVSPSIVWPKWTSYTHIVCTLQKHFCCPSVRVWVNGHHIDWIETKFDLCARDAIDFHWKRISSN